MKKFFATILALVYLTASSGATINLHYCMGKLMSWDLSHKDGGKCGTCGMDNAGHKGCCNDEQKQLKIEKDQKAAETILQFLPKSSDAVANLFVNMPTVFYSSTVVEYPTAHAPPGLSAVPIFVLNCNFRI